MPETISTKICSKCKIKQSLDAFFRNRTRAYGRSSYCKKCSMVCQRAYRKTEKGRKLQRKDTNKYHASEKGRETAKIRSAKYKLVRAFYLRTKARTAVGHAVRAGKLPSIDTRRCEKCGGQAHHYHHHLGYEKEHWLSVVPVCAICHYIAHA